MKTKTSQMNKPEHLHNRYNDVVGCIHVVGRQVSQVERKGSVVTQENHHLFEGVLKTKHILLPIVHIYEESNYSYI